MRTRFLIFITILLLLTQTNLGFGREISGDLIIFHAGSLSIPFRQIANEFMKRHPRVKILAEAAGSRNCARKISDLGRDCDVMASADYTVIEKLLIPEYADWNINFATNEMAIMYRPQSKFAKEINSNNWHEILLRKGVEYGHSDPNADPCGYRSQLVWQLAEKHYNAPGLYKKLVDNRPRRNIRSKETDLIALLEAGELDYIFIYRSICRQHKMPFVALPEQINLKDPRYADFYRRASVKISGKTPGSFIEKKGQAMVYGMTIPKNAPNYKAAVAFVNFVLSPRGQKIMAVNGQPPLVPAQVTGNKERVPAGVISKLQPTTY